MNYSIYNFAINRGVAFLMVNLHTFIIKKIELLYYQSYNKIDFDIVVWKSLIRTDCKSITQKENKKRKYYDK